jgi:hypothetical protein
MFGGEAAAEEVSQNFGDFEGTMTRWDAPSPLDLMLAIESQPWKKEEAAER